MSDKWFDPTTHSGWQKDMPLKTRRNKVFVAHGRDALASARSLQALANVTQDSATKRAAKADAKYFFAQHKKKGGKK